MDSNSENSGSELQLVLVDKECQITSDFLEGKLSFSEYEEQMENEESVDLFNDIESVSNDPPASTSQVLEKEKRKRREVRKLPAHLMCLMGEANVRYARGDHKSAEQICLEIIRQFPTAPDPFLTLGQIYEVSNPAKSLQFQLIAAHLNPNDEEQWIRLASLCEALRNTKEVLTCYANAIRANPTNINSHLKRIDLLTKLDDKKQVIRAKMRCLNCMTSEHHEILIPMATELAKHFHKEGEFTKAKEALDLIFKKCTEYIDSVLTNMMIEVLLSLKNYVYCLEIFVQHCNINLEMQHLIYTNEEGNVSEKVNIVSYQLPESLPIDLHIKFIICLIHLKSFDLIQSTLESLTNVDDFIENNGDLLLDIAEALMEESHYEDALKLLVPLVKSENFGLAAVWLRQAECLEACHLYEQAIDSYKKVMELAPMHLEMRLPLADILIKMNRKLEAISVLEQDATVDEINPQLLFKRCKLLQEKQLFSKFWEDGLLLLSRHCVTIRNRQEIERITCMQITVKRGAIVKNFRATLGEDVDDAIIFDNKNEPDVKEEYALFLDLVKSCMQQKRYDLMQRITFTALTSKKFKNHKNDILLKAIYACILNQDSYNGFNLIRELVQHNLNNNKVWNLYNIILQRNDDHRHNRFLMRLLSKSQKTSQLNILHANNCLNSGTYKYALNEYITLFKIKKDPMIAFLIGVTLFHIACQKFTVNKNYLVTQGIGFFAIYKQLRGPDGAQEANYNIGRGYHQLGLMHLAADYYKKVINDKPKFVLDNPDLDLTKEAAFNLYLIYKSSGAMDVAKMYLFKYIVV